MGRQERCDVCAEIRLPLVGEDEFRELVEAGARVMRLMSAVETFADGAAPFAAMRQRARDALAAVGSQSPPGEPAVVIGWWCDRCGNVDLPQPCLGVCVWRPVTWVGLSAYERERARIEPLFRAERSLRHFLSRAAAVTPRPGQEERNRAALAAQARVALADAQPSQRTAWPP
jgi:hypothetical protein